MEDMIDARPAELLSAPEAARALGLNRRTVQDRLVSGALAGWRVGGRWVVSRAEVERARAAGRLKPGRKRRDTGEGSGAGA